MRPPEGVHWTDAKVLPRPEIPEFCKNTDTPTSTVSPVAHSDAQELGKWFQDNVPGSTPTLFRTSNTPRPTGGLRPPVLQVLSAREAESAPPSSCPSPHSMPCPLLEGLDSATSHTADWLQGLAFHSLSHKDTQGPSFHTKSHCGIFVHTHKIQSWRRLWSTQSSP